MGKVFTDIRTKKNIEIVTKKQKPTESKWAKENIKEETKAIKKKQV